MLHQPPDIIRSIAHDWINGKSYYELYQILKKSKARMFAKSTFRDYKIEHIVDICDNGFAYDGMLIIGALIDILELHESTETNKLISRLKFFQKRLKFGLNFPLSILLYEMGFADRVLSSEISDFFENKDLSRRSVHKALLSNQDQIFRILDKYPIYFSEAYRRIIS